MLERPSYSVTKSTQTEKDFVPQDSLGWMAGLGFLVVEKLNRNAGEDRSSCDTNVRNDMFSQIPKHSEKSLCIYKIYLYQRTVDKE